MPVAGERATPVPEPVRAMVAPHDVLARHRWWILTAIVVGALVAAVYVVTVPRRYESTAALRFRTATELGAPAGVGAVERQLPKEVAIAGAGRVKAEQSVADAARRLGDISPAALREAITVRLDTATNQVDVVGHATTPRRAAQLAQAMAAAVVSREVLRVRDGLREPLRRAEQRLREAPDGPRGAALRAAVSEDLALMRSYALFARPVDLARPATIPRSPVRPRPLFDVLLGSFAGLACGLFGAYCSAVTRARTRRRRSAAYRVPGPLDVPARETAARIARTMEAAARSPVVGVFGSWRGSGRTTAALELADELAARGNTVALVEADLRAPSLARRLRLADGPGLAEVLAGTATAAAAMRPLARQRAGQVDCLPAGSPPALPDAVLAGPQPGELLAQLAASYDVIVVDTAAAELAADALELLALVDIRVICCADGGPAADGTLERALARDADHLTVVQPPRRRSRVRRRRAWWPPRRPSASRAA